MINYKTFISEEYKEPIMYHVVHKTSGQVVGKAKTRNRASRILDRKDNDYGGYAHIVKPIYEEKKTYSDSSSGAKEILKDLSSHKLSKNVEHIPDPSVEKTWLTLDHGKKTAHVTYHTGHHDLGNSVGDFEDVDYEKAKRHSRKQHESFNINAKLLTTNKNSMSTVLSQPGLYPPREKKTNNINYHKSGFSAGISGSPHQSDMVPNDHKEKYSSGFDQGRIKRNQLKKNKVDIPARNIVKNRYGETKPNKHYVKFLQTHYSKED